MVCRALTPLRSPPPSPPLTWPNTIAPLAVSYARAWYYGSFGIEWNNEKKSIFSFEPFWKSMLKVNLRGKFLGHDLDKMAQLLRIDQDSSHNGVLSQENDMTTTPTSNYS